jgi:hypothetical protein
MKVKLTKRDLREMLQAKYISSNGWGTKVDGKTIY